MKSEAEVQDAIRLAASELGVTLWRNNSGVLTDKRGQPVRFGLGNDSAKLNRNFKSPDLVGVIPVTIGPQHVGRVLGVFAGVEVKDPKWRMMRTEHEVAQEAFLLKVAGAGGAATFATHPDHVRNVIERVRR